MTTSTIDQEFRPTGYWKIDGAHRPHLKVTVASVDWNGRTTLHLLARPIDGGISYDYRCDGDCNGEGEGIVEYVTDDTDTSRPLTLGLLTDALEQYFLAADSLEEALDMAWNAANEGASDPYGTMGLDPDDPEYAYDFAENAYSFTSEHYPQLDTYFEQRVAVWRERKLAQENGEGLEEPAN